MNKRRNRNKTKGLSDTNEKIYFSEETEAAIIRYNESTDPEEREKIFREYIEYPLDKLAENIINRFKFPYVNQTFEDSKRQVVSFLVMNLSKYTQNKGKAFSYFSVIAKNYLILHNNNGYKHEKRSIYLSDKTDAEVSIEEVLMSGDTSDEDRSDAREFVRLMIEYWDDNIKLIFKKKRDIEIAYAVIELFRRADTIENFNKKSLYLLIREMTDCKTSYITKVVNKMRAHVLEHMKEYSSHGTLGGTSSKFFKYK